MIIADANILIHLAVECDQTPQAEALMNFDPVWAAPVLWRSEVRSGLMKYFHHGLMGFDSIMVSWHVAEETIAGREYAVDARKVLELAAQSKCTSYDCEYVALALDLGVSLVTTDKQVLKAFPKIAVSLADFAKRK